MKTCAAAILAAGCVAAGADNLLTNPGFEQADPFFVDFPLGWAEMPVLGPRWRQAGDDPFDPPIVRTGQHSIELPTLAGQRFAGWTTNTFSDQGELFDPPYVYGGGPITIRGWYAIPASDPLVNVRAGIKLEFRRTPPNYSIYLAFESLSITGHTNGQWRQFSLTVTQADFDYFHSLWGGPWPPYPTRVSVLPIRYLSEDFDVSDQSGTIFWDDLELVQEAACLPDLTGSADPGDLQYGLPDGQIDASDFYFFLDLMVMGNIQADLTGSTDPNSPLYGVPDGAVDASDVFFYLDQFVAGCTP